jgi:hypothetical protein
MKRTSTYEVLYRGRTIYGVTFATPAKPSELGRFSRYVPFAASRTLPYGAYVFRASLAFGKVAKSASWKFAVAKQERVAQVRHTH